MVIYIKGVFERHLTPFSHLHFKIHKIKKENEPDLYSRMVRKCIVIQPNQLNRRKYEVLDTMKILGKKDIVIGRMLRSRTERSWYRLVIYKKRI